MLRDSKNKFCRDLINYNLTVSEISTVNTSLDEFDENN